MSSSPVSQTQQLLDFLLEKKLIFPAKIQELKEEGLETGKDLLALLEMKGVWRRKIYGGQKRRWRRCRTRIYFGFSIVPEVLNLVGEELATTYQIIPIERKENVVKVGMVNPNDFKALGALNLLASASRFNGNCDGFRGISCGFKTVCFVETRSG